MKNSEEITWEHQPKQPQLVSVIVSTEDKEVIAELHALRKKYDGLGKKVDWTFTNKEVEVKDHKN